MNTAAFRGNYGKLMAVDHRPKKETRRGLAAAVVMDTYSGDSSEDIEFDYETVQRVRAWLAEWSAKNKPPTPKG